MESLYGYENEQIYINGQKLSVANDRPVIGQYLVNNEGSTDMYYKGAQLLNTLRHIVNDDEKWWKMILKYSETYRHKIIDTQTVISFFSAETKMNLAPIFNQYLNYTAIPVLEYKIEKNKIEYRWKTAVADFKMPIVLFEKGKEIRLNGTNDWQSYKIKKDEEISFEKKKFFIRLLKL